MTTKTILLVMASVFIIGFSAQNAFAASDYFLKLDGVDGESTDQSHQGGIAIDSWSFGASNPTSVGSGGLSAGKVQFQDFHFTKTLDKASPILFQKLATGEHIKGATFQVCRTSADGSSQCYLTITLSDVMVSSYQTGSEGGSAPIDQFSLNFSKIEFEYKPQKADGSLDAPVIATYDVKANKKI